MTRFDPWPDAQVHLEWAATGARLAAARGDAVVVVDVLSFSTSVTIAVSRGADCLILTRDELAELGGPESAAALLGLRSTATKRTPGPDQHSLSPLSLLAVRPGPPLLVTSLNGAAVTAAAAAAPNLLVGCLRNAGAVARLGAELLDGGTTRRLTIIACGEQWSTVTHTRADGLRVGVEDWVGAGLICSYLGDSGYRLSAEATLAASVTADLTQALTLVRGSVSARELIHRDFADDVRLAVEVDADDVVAIRRSRSPGQPGCALAGRAG